MAGYGNRGMEFERLIEYANARYRQSGMAMIEKQHTLCKPLRDGNGRIASAKYEEKATVDYVGRVWNVPVAFEAKHCSGDRIALDRVQEHQRKFLSDWTRDEMGIGFVFVSFGMERFFVIPWQFWRGMMTAREQGDGGCYLRSPQIRMLWQATGKASIKADEIPDECEARVEGIAGLDYPKVVNKLWRMN